MNSRELTFDEGLNRVNVNFDITYEELMTAIEGWELVLQEGVLQHMGQLLADRDYANQVCRLAAVMEEVRSALMRPPVPEPMPV